MAFTKNQSVGRRTFLGVLFLLGWVALIKGCPLILPDGIPTGFAASYEGLISVPKEGWDMALFESSNILEKNDRVRNSGKFYQSITCLQSSTAKAALDDILASSPREPDGLRSLWVSFDAIPRIATGRCTDRFARFHRRVHYGNYLQIKHIRYAKPLGCHSFDFILNHLRCPDSERLLEQDRKKSPLLQRGP